MSSAERRGQIRRDAARDRYPLGGSCSSRAGRDRSGGQIPGRSSIARDPTGDHRCPHSHAAVCKDLALERYEPWGAVGAAGEGAFPNSWQSAVRGVPTRSPLQPVGPPATSWREPTEQCAAGSVLGEVHHTHPRGPPQQGCPRGRLPLLPPRRHNRPRMASPRRPPLLGTRQREGVHPSGWWHPPVCGSCDGQRSRLCRGANRTPHSCHLPPTSVGAGVMLRVAAPAGRGQLQSKEP